MGDSDPSVGATLRVDTSHAGSVLELRSIDGGVSLSVEVGSGSGVLLRGDDGRQAWVAKADLRDLRIALQTLLDGLDGSAGTDEVGEVSEPGGRLPDMWTVVDGSTEIGTVEIGQRGLRFRWESSVVAWPASFTIERQPSSAVFEPGQFREVPFPGSTYLGNFDVSACDYEVMSEGEPLGWLKVNGTSVDLYALPHVAEGGKLLINSERVDFRANSETGCKTCHKIIDDAL